MILLLNLAAVRAEIRKAKCIFRRERVGGILLILPDAGTDITGLLHRLSSGDESVRGELMDAVYATLHRIARSHLSHERASHTLQPTALVNEAYLKLFGGCEIQIADRAHFFAIVSRAMRRVLVDHARARAAARRNGEHVPLDTLVEVDDGAGLRHWDFLKLDEALDALAREKNSLAELIELRYFGGMTAEESAQVVGRSVHVVRHELRLAHAWLRRELARQS
jgi:RNA polymerase sigma factor (TIGR02999 family)